MSEPTLGPHARLLSAFDVGTHHVKNRIALTAHGDRFADGGLVSERLIAHYERRAMGGVGLVVALGSAPVHRGFSGGSNEALVSLWNKDNDSLLLGMSERIHAHGATLLGQATHRGQRERPSGSNPLVVAPSSYPGTPPNGAPAVLREVQIRELVRAYSDAAARLEQSGFDGIEITASPSHLIENFWSPVLNRRRDAYGGALGNRLRFGIEVLEAIDRSVSKEFLIAFRMSGDLFTDDLGLSKDDLLEIAHVMDVSCRIDLFDITGGSGLDAATHAAAVPTDDLPVRCYNALANRIRREVNAPVLVAGRILDADSGEKSIHDGDCDMVGMTRALLADPDLPLRITSKETGRIRPCIAINEGCRRVVAGYQVACSVNPEVGNMTLGGPLNHRTRSRHILVVGAGPAGMEAARVASERGFQVSVVEQGGQVGGQIAIAAQCQTRPHLGGHIAWLRRELQRLSVDVRLGVTGDARMVQDLHPDAVVIATGARSYVPSVAKDLSGRAVTDVDILTGRIVIEPGLRLVVYDAEGYHRGGSIATFGADAGAEVQMITPFASPSENLESPNKRAMYRQLSERCIKVSSSSRIHGSLDGRLVTRNVWTNGLHTHDAADLHVFVGYYESETAFARTVERELPLVETHLIGDARAPRLLRNAVYEGAEVGRLI